MYKELNNKQWFIMKKTIKILLLSLCSLFFCGCVNFFKLSDLQPEAYVFPNNEEKARQLMKDMGVAHSIHLWDSIQTYNVTFEDEFYGFLGRLSHPFKEQKIMVSLDYIPTTFNGQLEILTGKEKGTIWGIQSYETYQKNIDGTITRDDNKDMKFWIPTYQYFIEFPSRIQEASSIDYIGEKVINGIKTEGIIASWNRVEKQKDVDQYIIWVDAISKRIVKIEYTVRDAYRFVTGAATFLGYKEYNGFLLPTELPVESNLLKKGFLHTMRIIDFKTNQVPVDILLPLE